MVIGVRLLTFYTDQDTYLFMEIEIEIKEEQILQVVKDNRIVESSYSLSDDAQKLILLCISKLDSVHKKYHQDLTGFEINALEYARALKKDKRNCYAQLKKAVTDLWGAEINLCNEKGSFHKIRWVQEAKYNSKNGSASILFSKHIVPLLTQLEGKFTQYDLDYVRTLTPYGVRVYELCKQYENANFPRPPISIEKFKNMLLIDDKYSDFKELKRRVLVPAIEDICKKTDIVVKLIVNFEKKKAVSINFDVVPKHRAAVKKTRNQKLSKQKTEKGLSQLMDKLEANELANNKAKKDDNIFHKPKNIFLPDLLNIPDTRNQIIMDEVVSH